MTGLLLKNSWLRKGLFLSAILFISLFGCKEDGELVPEFNSSTLNFNDVIISVNTASVMGDSVLSSGTSRNLLGKLNDQAFGLSSSEFYSQLELSSTSLNITDEVFDSIVLYLAYDDAYGFDYEHDVQVYELNEDLEQEKDYYSNSSVEAKPELLGSSKLGVTSIDTFGDSTYVLRVKLNNTLADRIKAEATFSNQDAWLEFFKGIKITTDENDVPANTGDGNGTIVYFNMLSKSTKMSLYYQDGTETKTIDFIVESQSARFSHFSTEYSDSLSSKLGKEEGAFNYIFAMAGSRTRITFNKLDSLVSSGRISVNKAELIIPYEEPYPDEYIAPARNVIVMKDASDAWVLPPDFFKGGSEFFGGIVSTVNKEYRFNLASTIHDMLSKGNFDQELYLSVSGGAVTANRLKLNSGLHPNRKIYLILSFTKSQ